jgi:hypothetical protein
MQKFRKSSEMRKRLKWRAFRGVYFVRISCISCGSHTRFRRDAAGTHSSSIGRIKRGNVGQIDGIKIQGMRHGTTSPEPVGTTNRHYVIDE